MRWTLLRSPLVVALLVVLFSGCDFVQQEMGIESPADKAARDEADGRAVGGVRAWGSTAPSPSACDQPVRGHLAERVGYALGVFAGSGREPLSGSRPAIFYELPQPLAQR